MSKSKIPLNDQLPLTNGIVCCVLIAALAAMANAAAPTEPAATAGAAGTSLRDSLRPAAKTGGLRMDGFFLWCSSVIKVGDTYHLFASRWPAEHGMGGWTNYSECVRATSTDLLGPYTFQEVVLQKRPGAWDRSRVHNVKIVKAGEKFVLYYINSANETGYATADAVTGPWTRSDKFVISASNPAALVRPDGSVYVFCRKRDENGVNRGIAFTAPSYKGPYTELEKGANLLPNGGELEDPTIWWAGGQYNILLNDWKGRATGIGKAGAQYASEDGIHYQLVTPEPVFTKTVKYDDGTEETFARRERPFIYVNERGEAEALFTACLPTGDGAAARIVAQPIDHYLPK
jgi:hypothetical protein